MPTSLETDKCSLFLNGLPLELMAVITKTKSIEAAHALPAISKTNHKTVHGGSASQFTYVDVGSLHGGKFLPAKISPRCNGAVPLHPQGRRVSTSVPDGPAIGQRPDEALYQEPVSYSNKVCQFEGPRIREAVHLGVACESPHA